MLRSKEFALNAHKYTFDPKVILQYLGPETPDGLKEKRRMNRKEKK